MGQRAGGWGGGEGQVSCQQYQFQHWSTCINSAVWPVPHTCTHPYHSGSGSHGQLFRPHLESSTWHNPRREVSLAIIDPAVYYQGKCKSTPLTLRAPISKHKSSKLISIHFLKELVGRICLPSKPFTSVDCFINSHNIFSWLCMDIVRRRLTLVTLGT